MKPQLSGFFFALGAFSLWGVMPVYWKQLQAVQPLEILCHRVVWSCVFLALIISAQKRWGEVRRILATAGEWQKLCLSGGLVGGNWLVFIIAVNSGHVVESSLGYYITPMVNVLIGFLFLGERFNWLQITAVVFASAGIGYSLLAFGDLPIYGLTLAFSFAFYGYARKKIKVAPIPGLFIETMFLLLPALAYIGYRAGFSGSLFLHQADITGWLIGAGVVTSLPLLCFASATRSLRLSTIGILQYLAPTISFVLGVLVYAEAFDQHSLVTFSLIWAGVLLYCVNALLHMSRASGRAS